jgi:hypothetical protein
LENWKKVIVIVNDKIGKRQKFILAFLQKCKLGKNRFYLLFCSLFVQQLSCSLVVIAVAAEGGIPPTTIGD